MMSLASSRPFTMSTMKGTRTNTLGTPIIRKKKKVFGVHNTLLLLLVSSYLLAISLNCIKASLVHYFFKKMPWSMQNVFSN